MEFLLTGMLMSPIALIVILIIALLIFGKRLPEVAKSLGKGIVEFKKGMKGIEEDIDRPLPPPSQPYNPQNQYQYPQGQQPYQPPQQQYGQSQPYAYQQPSYQGYGQQAAQNQAPGQQPPQDPAVGYQPPTASQPGADQKPRE